MSYEIYQRTQYHSGSKEEVKIYQTYITFKKYIRDIIGTDRVEVAIDRETNNIAIIPVGNPAIGSHNSNSYKIVIQKSDFKIGTSAFIKKNNLAHKRYIFSEEQNDVDLGRILIFTGPDVKPSEIL